MAITRSGIIYRATNKINGKAYVGLTTQSIDERIRKHYIDCVRHSYAFANALRKYNKEDWDWQVLYTLPIDQLNVAEICAIYLYDTYDNGYNSTLGGEDNPMSYKKYREKVRLSKIGKKRDAKTLKKMSASNKGKRLPQSTKEKISISVSGKNNGMYNKSHSQQSKLKMAINSGSKKFFVFRNGVLIGSWINKMQCSRDIGVDNSSITKCLKGKKKAAGGYIFSYKDSI